MMKLDKLILMAMLFIALPSWAWATSSTSNALNNVTYQYSATTWATTNTARVVVAVDATLKSQNVAETRQQILQKLNRLAKGVRWHITVFNRSQDQSGLVKLHVQAQARIPESRVNNLTSRVKSMSVAGQKYSVQSINFVPTMAATQKARTQLREQIYQQVNSEIKRLNAIYPKQQYFVHNIRFGMLGPVMMRAMVKKSAQPQPQAQPISVSQRIILNATVELASKVK